MGKIRMKMHPAAYVGSLLTVGVGTLLFSTWLNANLYDWPAIHAKFDRLEELEKRASVYDTMSEAGVGVWCQLAIHYDWIEQEDISRANEIILAGVHEKEKEKEDGM